jgi:hypothetical protein
MPIGIVAEVRDLTGVYDTNDLPDSRIESALQYGRGELYSKTFKTDWNTDTTHPLYYKAETVVHYFASFYILDRYSGNFEKANTHRQRAMELANELKAEYDEYTLVTEGDSGGSSKFSVAFSTYKTYPMNPDSDVYRSTTIIPGD